MYIYIVCVCICNNQMKAVIDRMGVLGFDLIGLLRAPFCFIFCTFLRDVKFNVIISAIN